MAGAPSVSYRAFAAGEDPAGFAQGLTTIAPNIRTNNILIETDAVVRGDLTIHGTINGGVLGGGYVGGALDVVAPSVNALTVRRSANVEPVLTVNANAAGTSTGLQISANATNVFLSASAGGELNFNSSTGSNLLIGANSETGGTIQIGTGDSKTVLLGDASGSLTIDSPTSINHRLNIGAAQLPAKNVTESAVSQSSALVLTAGSSAVGLKIFNMGCGAPGATGFSAAGMTLLEAVVGTTTIYGEPKWAFQQIGNIVRVDYDAAFYCGAHSEMVVLMIEVNNLLPANLLPAFTPAMLISGIATITRQARPGTGQPNQTIIETVSRNNPPKVYVIMRPVSSDADERYASTYHTATGSFWYDVSR